MIQAVGQISKEWQNLVIQEFLKHNLKIEFTDIRSVESNHIISFDRASTAHLESQGKNFYNWDLLFSVLGPNDTEGEVQKKLQERIQIFKSIKDLKSKPQGEELHGSIRVTELSMSARFYTWLFGVEPTEWTHRYVIFKRKDIQFNFVLLVADGKQLNHDTLYHLGMGVSSKQKVIEFYHSAVENNFHIEKPPRTTWRGTPLHEMWLQDPDGTPIEIYARLSDLELQKMPEDKEPLLLV